MPRAQNKETIIISLGGSLVVPEQIDVEFLERFRKVIQKYFKTKKFVIFVGGGKTARIYQNALAEFGASSPDKDWIGIDATKMNAKIVRQVFAKNSKNVMVSGGVRPGHSTDYIAVSAARKYKTKTIINLTNTDYVYDKNPKEFENAKPFESISWKDFQKIVGTKWSPGLSAPFDPRASLLAARQKIKVVIINGKNLQELEKFLAGKKFIGTVIL